MLGVDLDSRRLNGQRLAGVGTILLGVAQIAIWMPDLARGAIVPVSAIGLFGALSISGFGIGALYRPATFGAATREERAAN